MPDSDSPILTVNVADPATGRAVRELHEGDRLAPSELPAGATLLAVVNGGKVGSVRFAFDGQPVRVETSPPLCISGDADGKLNPWDGLRPGSHELILTAFPEAGGNGEPVTTLPIRFIVLDPATPRTDADPGLPPLPPGATETRVPAGQPIRPMLARVRPGVDIRVLLERGGTWHEPIHWTAGGRGPDAPAVLGSYGDPARPPPRILTRTDGLVFDRPLADVLIQGIDFEAVDYLNPDRPDHGGIRIRDRVDRLAVRDVGITGFADCAAYEHVIGDRGRGPCEDHLWDRCRFLDAWGHGRYSGQGLYVAFARRVMVRDSLLARCGMLGVMPAKPRSGFAHGNYSQGWTIAHPDKERAERGETVQTFTREVRFERVVAAECACYGFQNRGKAGVIEGCFAIDVPIPYLVNGPDPCRVAGNVGLTSGTAHGYEGSPPWGGGGIDFHARGVLENNVLVLLERPAKGAAFKPAVNVAGRADQPWCHRRPVHATGTGNVTAGWPRGKAVWDVGRGLGPVRQLDAVPPIDLAGIRAAIAAARSGAGLAGLAGRLGAVVRGAVG
jgi:hypothetical protein